MSDLDTNIHYLKILQKIKRYHPYPTGFSNHNPQNIADQITIKQNNLIIGLLIEVRN